MVNQGAGRVYKPQTWEEAQKYQYERVGTSGRWELWYHRWGAVEKKWRVIDTFTNTDIGEGFRHYPSIARMKRLAGLSISAELPRGTKSKWTFLSHPWQEWCDTPTCEIGRMHRNSFHTYA